MSAVAVADQLMTMEFQCEFGPEATSDSLWHAGPRDPRKDFSGTQLCWNPRGQATRTDSDCRQRSERGCLWADRQ